MRASEAKCKTAHPTQLVCVAPDHVRWIWPLISQLLKQAITKTGLCAFADIERDVLAGDALVWIAWDGSAIEAVASTCLQQTEAGKICIITACAGTNMAHWLPLIRGIETYAVQEGCRCVRIFGRKGWARVLDGYRQTHAIIDRMLG